MRIYANVNASCVLRCDMSVLFFGGMLETVLIC